MLVMGVSPSALGAEPVEHRDAPRADEIRIRAAAGRRLAQVEPERTRMLLRFREQLT